MRLSSSNTTLCHPDGRKSCFRCCPPIRPAGYDHLEFRGFISRELREHTATWRRNLRVPKPITGYSCWALGFLDPGCGLIGCLLHPAVHQGRDLRHLVGYGDKCRMAVCPQAMEFDCLRPEHRTFWLHFCEGLDSFEYSSPSRNPLFVLLPWGGLVLGRIAEWENTPCPEYGALLDRFPFLKLPLSGARRYVIERWMDRHGRKTLQGTRFIERFQEWWASVIPRGTARFSNAFPGGPPVGRLDMEKSFRDFLRLGLGLPRSHPGQAALIRAWIEKEIVSAYR